MSMESSAMAWLRFQKRCYVVLFQRKPVWNMGDPDVFGVTWGRKTYEIEIKRTLSDFRADSKKTHIANRENGCAKLHLYPTFFSYLVPKDLVEKVTPEVPAWAGLMGYNPDWAQDKTWVRDPLKIFLKAPENKLSQKFSLKQMGWLMLLMGSQLTAQKRALDAWNSKDGDCLLWDRFNDWERDYRNYQI